MGGWMFLFKGDSDIFYLHYGDVIYKSDYSGVTRKERADVDIVGMKRSEVFAVSILYASKTFQICLENGGVIIENIKTEPINNEFRGIITTGLRDFIIKLDMSVEGLEHYVLIYNMAKINKIKNFIRQIKEVLT